jgi:hypothetical protein
MGWTISTFDKKYQIKYGSNTTNSYLLTEDDVSYLTITDTKQFGINNEKPSSNYLLDINGITHINSNLYITGNSYISNSEYINSNLYISSNVHVANILYTSNIIGVGTNNSNNININYTLPTFSNNTVQIYGTTSFIGRVNIENQTSNSFHLLDINGSINAKRIYGDGCNIYNINASNISLGILETEHGGTGINRIFPEGLLYGGATNNIIQSAAALKYSGSTLYAPSFEGKINAANVDSGILRVKFGGTGVTAINSGWVPYGNGTDGVQSSADFAFNQGSKTLELNTLRISNSNIFVKNPDNTVRKYHYNDIGIYDATSNSRGIVLPSPSDFNTSNGILTLKTAENIVWSYNVTGSNIYFPNDIRLDSGQICSAGINIRDPMYQLDVNGDINTSNGLYRINGVDIKQVVIDFAIANLKLDALSGVKVQGMRLHNPAAINDLSSGRGLWKINADVITTMEVDNLVSVDKTFLNNLLINNTSGLETDTYDINNAKNILEMEDNTYSIFKFTKAGNMLIGNKDTVEVRNIPPSQKLEVIGNIHATGYIRSYYSDDRLKTLTSNITGALNIIDSLKGFHYVPNDKALELGFAYDNEIGLSAQQVQKVVPEIVKIAPFDTVKDIESGNLVSKSGEDYLTICYERLGAVFVEAIKELRQENKELKKELSNLKKEIENIKKIIYIN